VVLEMTHAVVRIRHEHWQTQRDADQSVICSSAEGGVMQALMLQFDGVNVRGRNNDDSDHHDHYVIVESEYASEQSHQYNDDEFTDEDVPIRNRDRAPFK
jgi:single-stranded DNA-binding protein